MLVDNDVNIMALGEYWSRWRDTAHLLFVKVGTGIGCGVITDGRIHRGAQGAAGDIGHIHVPDHDDVICRCGNLGCLEAIAGGGAMATRLTDIGIPAENSRDVVRHVRDGRPEAMRLVRQAGRELGGVLASAVNFFNPAVIVIGGDIAHADEHLLAGVREVVYRRSTALATRSIRIARSTLDDRAGVIGAAVMVIEAVLAPDAVDQAIATGSRVLHAVVIFLPVADAARALPRSGDRGGDPVGRARRPPPGGADDERQRRRPRAVGGGVDARRVGAGGRLGDRVRRAEDRERRAARGAGRPGDPERAPAARAATRRRGASARRSARAW